MIDDLVGQNYGQLKVTEFAHCKRGKSYWVCVCSCGNKIITLGNSLKTGNTNSCGCYRLVQLRKKMVKHGDSGTKLHNCWKSMLDRCYNPKCKAFSRYGERGIKVSQPWHDYNIFKRDMIASCKTGLTLERIDNNADYSKENCKWATRIEQSNNQRCSRFLELNGKRQTVSMWAREIGKHPATIHCRIARGWPVEKILSPIKFR